MGELAEEGEETFEMFVARVEPQLQRALAGHLSPDMVGDAVAEALAYAWEHRRRVLEMDNPAGYLFRVAQSRSRRRRQGVLPWQSDDTIPDIEPGLPAALTRLSRRQARAVWLVHAAGFSHAEAAVAMGVSPSTVASHVERGMARLRDLLGVEE